MLTQTDASWTPTTRGDQEPELEAPADRCEVDYRIANDWGSGFQAEVTVRNTGDATIDGWQVSWPAVDGQSIDSLWNGTVSSDGSTVADAVYNARIEPGSSASFGFTATGTSAVPEAACTVEPR